MKIEVKSFCFSSDYVMLDLLFTNAGVGEQSVNLQCSLQIFLASYDRPDGT